MRRRAGRVTFLVRNFRQLAKDAYSRLCLLRNSGHELRSRPGDQMCAFSHVQLMILVQSPPIAETSVGKGLEAAVSFAQSLSQWAYIVIGASVALLFKDSTHRPSCRFVR